MIFLIEYDRQKGRLVNMVPFEDGQQAVAQRARLEMELRLHRLQVEHEVVLLDAETEEAMRSTHRRYFEDLEELAKVPTASDS
jgi:hypothetical protein